MSKFKQLNSIIPVIASQGSTPFYQRVIATTPIAYWPLSDLTGVAADDLMDLGNGTYKNTAGTLSGVTLGQTGIGDGRTAAAFTGSYCNIYSAALNTAFTPQQCTIMIWGKCAAGVWTDATVRTLMQLRADVSNRISIVRTTTNNELQAIYAAAGGGTDSVSYSTPAPTDWFCLALTIDKGNDQMKLFYNGAQVGSTVTGLGTWAGALTSTVCTLAASSTSSGTPWDGLLAHAAVWSRTLSPAEVASLSNPF